MDNPTTGLLEAEARLYALETAVRMLVTIVMKDQPRALASIAASVRENASSHIDRVVYEDEGLREQMRKATLDELEQILTPFQVG